LKSKCQKVELPHILEKSKEKAAPKPKGNLEFKCLPKEIKYTNDEKYTDIDKVRSRMRMNEIDHLHFDPKIGGKEGKIYFKDIYSTTYNNEELKKRGEHEH